MAYSSVEFMSLETTTPSRYNKKDLSNFTRSLLWYFSFRKYELMFIFLMGFSFTGMGSTFYKFNYIYHVSMY